MTQAAACISTPPLNTPSDIDGVTTSTSAIALLQRAGMRLQRQGNRYAIIWRRQEVVAGLTLLECAVWIERALNR